KGEEKSLESRIGENYLQKIGVVVFLLGVSFFLKYSFDQGWIGPMARILLGLVAGVAFLGAGEYFVKKYKEWSNVMTGGGIAILYFSIFAAREFYELVPYNAAFAGMFIVTIIAGFMAVRHDSKPLAIIGIAGGFLTPIIIESPDPSHLALMVYAYILSLGVLGISYFKKWNALISLAFFMTAIYGAVAWEELAFNTSMFLLVIFLLIYSFMPFYQNLIKKEKVETATVIQIVLTASYVFFSAAELMDGQQYWKEIISLAALVLGVYYFAQAALAFSRTKNDDLLLLTLSGVSIALLTIIIPLELEGFQIPIAFLIEGLLLLWTGFRVEHIWIRRYGAIVGSIGVLTLFNEFGGFDIYEEKFLVNGFVGTMLVLIATSAAATYLYEQNKAKSEFSEKDAQAILGTIANVAMVLLITHQIVHYFELKGADEPYEIKKTLDQTAQFTISIAWTLYSIALIAIGIMKRLKPARWMGLILFGITILKVLLVDLAGLSSGYRVIAFMVLGLFLIATSFSYQKYKHIIHEKVL
ncbi:MAG: DUF2339 domain-containing protein, partial [Candidatus Peregrinibacteria bacterium]|nr:DUF2339 domain-containing protein [Candidatus Peregrinibacteria bacterium]